MSWVLHRAFMKLQQFECNTGFLQISAEARLKLALKRGRLNYERAWKVLRGLTGQKSQRAGVEVCIWGG